MNEAEHLRDLGMERSLEKATRVYPTWDGRAYHALKAYIKLGFGYFTCEDAREWIGRNHPMPQVPDKRAWGSLMARAAREGLIEPTGYRKTRSVSRHRGISTLWRRK
jgi:hypothetical protein